MCGIVNGSPVGSYRAPYSRFLSSSMGSRGLLGGNLKDVLGILSEGGSRHLVKIKW